MIDTMVVHDVRPFWQAVVDGDHETIVHAGRGEMEFCLQAVDRLPKKLFDVQLAAGLAGIEYPAGYGTLVAKLLGESSQKQETRTDWRKRPLSKRQIDYAVQDVYYLGLIRDRVYARLEELGRLAWMKEETAAWCEELCRATSSERWRRVSGNSGLDPRSLAIVHELWKWREGEAKHRDQPARRVLRDDLIIELAKRQTADVKRIRAVRGLERGDLVRGDQRHRRLYSAGLGPAGRGVSAARAAGGDAAAFRARAVPLCRLGQRLSPGPSGPEPRGRTQ